MRGLTCFSAEKNRWDNICRTVLKGLNSYISLLRNRRLMRKASNFKVINIWFSYRIPIGSRRILQFPWDSDYRIQLSEIVGSDIRQLPVGFLSEVIGLFGVSCRIRWDPSLGFLVLGCCIHLYAPNTFNCFSNYKFFVCEWKWIKFPHHMMDVLFTSDDIESMIRVPMSTNEIFEDDSRRVGNKSW